MIYDLPAGPPITVVGPDDTPWWTTLGLDPAGRHALVLGDPAAPRDATILTGPLSALDAYLQHLTRAVHRAAGHPEYPFVPDGDTMASHRPATFSASAPRPVHELVRLPHTGISVPDPDLRVTALQLSPGPDGDAYTGTLRLGRRVAGVLVNDGFGGPTGYQPAPGSPLSPRLLAAVVAASRDEHGDPIAETEFLDALVTEYENVQHVEIARRLGRSAVRMRAPLGADDVLAASHYTARCVVVAAADTPEQRDELIAALHQQPTPEGAWWQLWTGDRWDDLTAPSPNPPEEPAP